MSTATPDESTIIFRWSHAHKAWLVVIPTESTKLYLRRFNTIVGNEPFIVQTQEQHDKEMDKIVSDSLK